MFTDECIIVLYAKINPKINIIRLNQNDKKNIHSYEVNKKRTFFRPKFEISLMVAGGISKFGLSNLVFCSGTMNNFSYWQFLLFIFINTPGSALPLPKILFNMIIILGIIFFVSKFETKEIQKKIDDYFHSWLNRRSQISYFYWIIINK